MPRDVWRSLWFGPAIAAQPVFPFSLLNPHALVAASTLLVLWLGSPLVALGLARSREIQPRPPLGLSEERLIRSIARDTWRFFEQFVGPTSCWLPPDNVQEYPKRVIAERTSPTNVGMMLLSTLTAYDLGYLGQRQLLARLTNHLDTVHRMRKHRGHLFNWYSTRDLRPLEPLYVSTVDSGNLVAALIVMRQTLDELPRGGLSVERTLRGVIDELAALRRQLSLGKSVHSDAVTRELIDAIDTAREMLSGGGNPLALVQLFEQCHCGPIEQAFLHAVEQDPDQWSAEEIANFRENNQVLRQRTRMILEDAEKLAAWSTRLAAPPATLLRPEYLDRCEGLLSALGSLPDVDNPQEQLESISGDDLRICWPVLTRSWTAPRPNRPQRGWKHCSTMSRVHKWRCVRCTSPGNGLCMPATP